MKKQYLKSTLLSIIFILALSLGMHAETIKILAVGNSFSEDAVEDYLYELGQAGGVTFVIGNMFISGCSLPTHWNNAANNKAAYSYRKIAEGKKNTKNNTTLEAGILDEDWDYISFQALSSDAGIFDRYFPYLTNLKEYVKGKAVNPDVQFILHQTWAYAQNSTHSGFNNYGKSQTAMYNAVVDAVNRAAEKENISIIIPTGTAIQNARTSFLGDNLCRDGYHLDYGIGRYIAACTWYEKLTGKNVVENPYAPSMTAFRKQAAQQAAHAAVQNPFGVTDLGSSLDVEMPVGSLNAVEFKEGHGGMSCGPLSFTEKDITIELWLNIPSASFNGGVTIASTRHDGSRGFSLDVSSDGRLRGFFRNDNGDKLNSRPDDFIFPFFFAKEDVVDKWVHIALVFSSTNNIARSYLNGEMYEDLVKSTEPYQPYNIGWIGNHTSGLRVGYWYNDASKLNGKIADFRIWNSCRTDAEIKENYNKPLTGKEPGLYIYYNFNSFHQVIDNIAALERNPGNLQPAGTWNSCFSYESLAAKPVNIALAGGRVGWEGKGQSWDIEIISKSGGEVLKAETVYDKSFTAAGIAEGTDYYINIRTLNNGFYSGWVSFDPFKESSILSIPADKFHIYSADGSLIINSDVDAMLNLYAPTGQLIRKVNITAGRNTLDLLDKGMYLLGNQKVIIR